MSHAFDLSASEWRQILDVNVLVGGVGVFPSGAADHDWSG